MKEDSDIAAALREIASAIRENTAARLKYDDFDKEMRLSRLQKEEEAFKADAELRKTDFELRKVDIEARKTWQKAEDERMERAKAWAEEHKKATGEYEPELAEDWKIFQKKSGT